MATLAEPFAQIFTDQAEADWAFDLLRDTAMRLGIRGAYDPRFAITLAQRSGRLGLHLNFGGWLVIGFHGPGQSPVRVDLALLADQVAWDERIASFPFDRKEGEREVRSYHLPLETIRPMTSDLTAAYETTLDFIAQKFQHWKRASHWQQHNPEIAEALFKPEQRERVFAGLLAEPELRYERHLTAFYQDLSEEPEEYEVGGEEVERREDEDTGEGTNTDYLPEGTTYMNLTQEQADQYDTKKGLAKPFSQIFVDREEAEWAFDLLLETFQRLGVKNAKDERIALTFRDYQRLLRFDFGNWAVIQFYPPNSFYRAGIALISDEVKVDGKFRAWEPFAQSEPEVRVYDLPIEIVKPMGSDLRKVYEETFSYIARRFQRWKRSPYRKFHQMEVAQAVFDLEIRKKLFNKGLSEIINVDSSQDFDRLKGFESDVHSHLVESEAVSVELNPLYPLPQLAEDTGFDEAELERWVRAVERKGQAILYGPPGTGKTFMAEKLARHLVGGGDGWCELMQFHPAYAYEDFIQGIRPQTEGDHLSYPVVPGRFLEFCREAGQREGRCVLIIDEINRANLSRVFGELMYLLEYREQKIPLAGGGEPFQIPANVRLIGTMNTADRSIALVDHALRRRFAFLALYPNYNLLRRYHQREQTGFPVEGLIDALTSLNRQIGDRHYEVGVTFFLCRNLAEQIEDIWRMEIEPYLEEYFFDRPESVESFRWDKVKSRIWK